MILLIILLTAVIGAGATLAEAWLVMLTEGALAGSMDLVIPTLSYESSIWLALVFGALGTSRAISEVSKKLAD